MAVQLLHARQGLFVLYGAECQAELPKPPRLQQAVVHHFHVHMACVVADALHQFENCLLRPFQLLAKTLAVKDQQASDVHAGIGRAGVGRNLGHHLQRLVGGEGAHIEDFVECGVHKSGPI